MAPHCHRFNSNLLCHRVHHYCHTNHVSSYFYVHGHDDATLRPSISEIPYSQVSFESRCNQPHQIERTDRLSYAFRNGQQWDSHLRDDIDYSLRKRKWISLDSSVDDFVLSVRNLTSIKLPFDCVYSTCYSPIAENLIITTAYISKLIIVPINIHVFRVYFCVNINFWCRN